MSRRVNVRGIIYRDGKLFAVRHRRPEGERNFWCTPGGGLNDTESLIDGVKREILEETGVMPVVGKLLFIQQFKKPADITTHHDEYLEFFFDITNTDDFDHVNLSATSHGEAEIKDCAWIELSTPDLYPAFLQTSDFDAIANSSQPSIYDNL